MAHFHASVSVSHILRFICVVSVLLCSSTDTFAAKGIYKKIAPKSLGYTSLKEGDKVIFVHQVNDKSTNGVIMGDEYENYRLGIKTNNIDTNNNTIENPDSAAVFEVRVDESFTALSFNVEYYFPYQFMQKQPDGTEKYLYTWSGYVIKMVGADESNKPGFHFRLEEENGRFKLKGKQNSVQYLENYGDLKPGFYGQAGYNFYIQIFKLVPGTDVADVSAPVIEYDYNEVAIKSDEGTTIYYTIDGSTPTVERGLKYDMPIQLTRTTTVKAIAVYNGVKSDVSEQECKYVEMPTVTWRTVSQALEDGDEANESAFPLEGVKGGVLFSLTAPEGHSLWYSLTQQDGASSAPIKRAPGGDITAHSIPLTEVPSGHVDNILVQTSGHLDFYSQHPETNKYSNVRRLMLIGQTSANDIYNNDMEDMSPIYYNTQGQIVNMPTKGIYLCRRGHVVTKVIIP